MDSGIILDGQHGQHNLYFGRGNYACIPHAGMIGTMLVHALANFLSTFIPNIVCCYWNLLSLDEMMSKTIVTGDVAILDASKASMTGLTIDISNLQYDNQI